MFNKILPVVVSVAILACTPPVEKLPDSGLWLAQLDVMDGKVLPFNFRFNKNKDGLIMEIYNAKEVITIDEIDTWGDSILIKMPVFEGYIEGRFTRDSIGGSFIKESLDRVVPFQASHGELPRFTGKDPAELNVSGIWEVEFSPETDEAYPAKGIFTQRGNEVSGTFRTTTGDYRYLEGIMDGDSMKLSTFDGAHAFLFTSRVTDSTMQGIYYSGNHFKEPFTGHRNDSYELPDGDSLTFLRKGYDKVAFAFPDASGKTISLEDPEYSNKVVIVQIMGTWCPNCLDETKFLTSYLEKNKDPGLEVVALAFEHAKTREDAYSAIDRLQKRIGVPYPVVLAQFGSSDKLAANKKLPMLNHVLSYPTTLFIDKKGVVRKIHTGFNGPATGERYTEFKDEFESFVTGLLAE